MEQKTAIASECSSCATAVYGDNKIDDNLVELIVDEVVRTLGVNSPQKTSSSPYPLIPLGVSTRHIHISQGTFEKLFGAGTAFESYRALYQPGEFASKHVVTIVGPRMRSIQGVRILGPFRNYDQVEISLTDAIQLGVNPPIRNAGDLKGAEPLTLIGPKGSIYLTECAIIANRHIHMTNDDAKIFGVKAGDFCRVKIGGEKSTILENVLIRTKDSWKLQLHLDTDDANAANIRSETYAEFLEKM